MRSALRPDNLSSSSSDGDRRVEEPLEKRAKGGAPFYVALGYRELGTEKTPQDLHDWACVGKGIASLH